MTIKIGQLEIDLLANVARLQADMNQVKNAVGGSMSEVRRMVDMASSAFAALGVALSIGALVSWVRSAVDAADATKALSEKTGLAARDVAGLQLAYQQAGLGGDAMSTSIAKLSKQMVEGNKAFDDLGIKTRNADGTMRDTKDVLYDVADAFEGMKDGAAKAAFAQELFSKGGADLIPLLNGGSAGLREMADMASKLGLVIDKDTAEAADRFNDTTELLGMGLSGMSRQIAAQLLPTLNSLAGNLLESMTQGDGLRRVAEGLAVALKSVYSVGAVVVEVFATAGKAIGGVAAAIVMALSGDFAGAKTALDSMAVDIKTGWASTAKTVSAVWQEAGGSSTAAMAAVARAQRDMTLKTKEQEEAAKAAAAAAKQHAAELEKLHKAGLDLIAGLQARNAVTTQELALGRSLNDSEKATAELEAKLRDGKISLSATELALARTEIARTSALADQRAAQEAVKRWLDETARANLAAQEALQKHTATLQDQVEQQRTANREAGLSAEQLERVRIAHLLDAAAAAERSAALMDEVDWTGQTSDEYRKQAAALRELADLKEQGIHIKAAQDAAEEWKKTTDSIGAGLTDALMRGFESGKGFMDNLKSVLINGFKTLVLEPIIKPIMQAGGSFISSAMGSVGSSLAGMLGLGGSGGAAASTGGLGSLGSLGGLLGGGGSFGSGLGAGFSSLLGEGGLMGALDAGGIAMGAGNIMGGLGSIAGAMGPIGMGIAAVYTLAKALDHKRTPHMGAAVTTDALGLSAINDGSALGHAGWGGWNADRDNGIADVLKGVGTSVVGTLSTLNKAFGGSTAYTTAQAFHSDNEDPSGGHFRLMADGKEIAAWAKATFASSKDAGYAEYVADVAKTTRSALDAMALPDWAKDTIDALGAAPSLDQLSAVAASIAITAQQLAGMGTSLGTLGGVFGRISGLSSDAQYQLAQFAGGIDALISKSASFVQTYYSADEQAGLQAADVLRQFTALGLDTPASMADFRALVESQDLGTEQGRLQLAALLDMADEFASVQTFLASYGGSIDALAAAAPPGAIFADLTDAQQRQATIAQQQADLAARQAAAAEATVGAITSMSTALGSKLDLLRNTVADGFARQASSFDEMNYGGAGA